MNGNNHKILHKIVTMSDIKDNSGEAPGDRVGNILPGEPIPESPPLNSLVPFCNIYAAACTITNDVNDTLR